MPLCPNCSIEAHARRKGACPNCSTPVLLIDNEWITSIDGNSPTISILKHFCQLVSERETARTGTLVTYKISQRTTQYRRELSAAKRLLKEAGNDTELVLATLTRLFKDRRWGWKNRTSLMHVNTDFSVAMALEASIRKRRREAEAQERELAQSLEDRAKIFSQ